MGIGKYDDSAYIRNIVDRSYSIIPLSDVLEDCFQTIRETFNQVSDTDKKRFTFPQHTDGFLPFGAEYSMIPEHPDLCERYCYWSKQGARHKEFLFANSAFYQAVAAYEQEISVLAGRILDEIHDYFGAPRQPSTKESSYCQYCAYLPQFRRKDREFLQDMHEDGHILSFIKPSCSGLMIMQNGSLQPLEIGKNEIAVLAGSLLTVLSDGEIPALIHAVSSPPEAISRQSLMYFVNPHPTYKASTFRAGKPADLLHLADERHKSFGNAQLLS